MRKYIPALLRGGFLLSSCGPQNMHCIVHNKSSSPLRVVMLHCKPKWPAFITVFMKSEKRNRYSYDESLLPAGDTLHIDKQYQDGYGKVRMVALFRQDSRDTLEVARPSIGTWVVDVSNDSKNGYVSFRKGKK